MVLTIWKDTRGWEYKVMTDLSGKFRARYHKAGSNPMTGWKSCRNFEPKETLGEAQIELNRWAKKKGMQIVCRFDEA